MATPRPFSRTLASSIKWITLLFTLLCIYFFVVFCDPARDVAWTSVLLAVSIIAVAGRRDREYIQLTILLTVVLGLLYWLRYGFLGLRPVWEAVGYCSLFGIAAVLASIILSSGGRDTFRSVVRVSPGIMLCLFYLGASNLSRLLPTGNILLRDYSLLELDRRVGLAFSDDAGAAFHAFPILRSACALIYALIALWIAIAGVLGKKHRKSYWVSIFVATVTGSLAYRIVPAIGPFHVWGARFHTEMIQFYDYSRSLRIPSKLANCMPSLHATWAMLVFWNLWNREHRWLRLLGAMILIGTVLATLGLGEHYVIDIVVAVPFAYAIHAATNNDLPWPAPARLYPTVVGSLVFLMWEVLLGTGAYRATSTGLLYALILVSMLLPASPVLWLEPGGSKVRSLLVATRQQGD